MRKTKRIKGRRRKKEEEEEEEAVKDKDDFKPVVNKLAEVSFAVWTNTQTKAGESVRILPVSR
eukprot:749091-Hanusia_phi.AAC.2